MAWSPTTDQILNLDGVRVRTDEFRFELCDREWKPIGTLQPDRSQSVPTIQNDTSNSTLRRLTGFKLLNDEVADVNYVTDRVRVYMVLQNGAEYLLGSFLWASGDEPVRSWGSELHSELVDVTHILNQKQTQAFGWGRGPTITLVMFFLLFRAGFELNEIKVIGDEAARGLADPVAWQPGSTWMEMLTDLGNLVGFVPPWADRYGNLMLDQPPNPEVAPTTVPEYEDNTRVISDSIVYSNGLLTAPNDFGAYDSGTSAMKVGRYQLPNSAPHSFSKRGYRVGEVINVQGATNQTMLNKSARNLAARSDVYETLTFDSTADPRHDTYDVVPAFGETWLETSWSLQCRSGGPMSHSMNRLFYDVT